MLVVNPTPYSIPLNSANVATESVETQNKFAVSIPESKSTAETSKNKSSESGQQLGNNEGSAKNAELREEILGKNTKSGSATPEQTKEESSVERQEQQQVAEDQKIIRELAASDRRVRAHEQAHASVGGSLAGSPSFTFKTGPNGVRYAIAGEVSIDASGVPGNPQATLRKAEQVSRAALAPADPSSTDRRVASSAQALASKARYEIARLTAEKVESRQAESQARLNGEEFEEDESFQPTTSLSGDKLHTALATDATEQVGGQVSASA